MSVRLLALALASALTTGAARATLLERAIRARGGPLLGLVRSVEAEVHAGFPGTWQWRTALAADRYAWSIVTADEMHHYLYDGVTVRAFVGEHPVTAEPAATAPLRTHARFAAVANLDALLEPGVQAASLDRATPSDGTAGLDVTLADGTAYRLLFDHQLRLVRLTGPVSLEPFGAGELVAEFADFRRVGGYVLPHRTVYRFRGERVAEERALAVCPHPKGLDDAGFTAPARLPVCE